MSAPGPLVCCAGAVTAAGTGLGPLVQALSAPDWRAEVGLERPDAPPLPVVHCRDFSPKGVLPPMVARRLDRPARLLAVAAREALAPWGDVLPWGRDRVGVAAGTWNAGTTSLVEVLRAVFLASPDEAPPAEFPSTVANAAASQLGILERLSGPNLTFAEKQVGGLRALAEAARMLDRGRVDAVLAGGVDEANWLYAEGYERLGSLRRPGSPGMVLGEGAALLLLAAEPVGRPLARLAGWGSAAASAAPHLYPDSPAALEAACHAALDRAGLRPAMLDLVVSLANGVPALERLEREAMAALLGTHRPAACAVADRLGEGAFCGAARAVVAALAIAGHATPAWGPPPLLAEMGLPAPSASPGAVLVAGQAGGGSAIALVLTSA